MAPVQISGHAGTFPNSVLILSEELSRKIIAYERNEDRQNEDKKMFCMWLDGIDSHKLVRKIHSVLFALMTSSCFQNVSFFLLFLCHYIWLDLCSLCMLFSVYICIQ